MQDMYGNKVMLWSRRPRLWKRSQRTPLRREKVIQVLMRTRWYLLHWAPRAGWWLRSSGPVGTPIDRPDYVCPRPEVSPMKRRQPAASVGACAPALPATSTLLAKLPALREFLSATAYDDGSPRMPGYLTLRNRGHSYEVTLYDPDAGLRLPVRGPEIDRTLLLAEQLLGVEEAPWEFDQYLSDQLARRTKKKRAS